MKTNRRAQWKTHQLCAHASAGWLLADGKRVATACAACAAIVTAANAGWTFEATDDVDVAPSAPEPPVEEPAAPAPQRAAVTLAPEPVDPFLLGIGAWVSRQRALGVCVPNRRAA